MPRPRRLRGSAGRLHEYGGGQRAGRAAELGRDHGGIAHEAEASVVLQRGADWIEQPKTPAARTTAAASLVPGDVDDDGVGRHGPDRRARYAVGRK